jgi:hypothetical protein
MIDDGSLVGCRLHQIIGNLSGDFRREVRHDGCAQSAVEQSPVHQSEHDVGIGVAPNRRAVDLHRIICALLDFPCQRRPKFCGQPCSSEPL